MNDITRTSKEPVSHGPCGSCGMIVASDEYHPFAACLMHEACRNSETVRANLDAVIDHGYKASRASPEPPAEPIGFVARAKSDGTIFRDFAKTGEQWPLADGCEWMPVYERPAPPPGVTPEILETIAFEHTGSSKFLNAVQTLRGVLRSGPTKHPSKSLCPNCGKDEVGTFTADDWFLYGVEKQFRLMAKDVLFFRCMACGLEFTGEDGEQKRLQAVRDHLDRATATKQPAQPPVPALQRIIEAYDAYRGRGVMPAPNEYANLVAAIDAARSALTKQPEQPPAPARCHCGAHEWPYDAVQIEDSHHRLHTLRGCQPGPTKQPAQPPVPGRGMHPNCTDPCPICDRMDAERYRWLRGRVLGSEYRRIGFVYSEPSDIDAQIDRILAYSDSTKESEHG